MVGHEQLSCPACGAALEFVPRRDDSGWVELPPIRDMARLRVGASTCQIEGTYVPVADFNLAEGDGVYFAHHVLLWRDPGVLVGVRTLPGVLNRALCGVPVVMTEAAGPGHIAFSFDEPGELIAVPLQPGQTMEVREHAFLAATNSVAYDWAQSGACYFTGEDEKQKSHYAVGQFLDCFSAAQSPGLLLVHAGGNAFIRDLRDGEWLLVRPGSFLFKSTSVRMGMVLDMLPRGMSWQQVLWLQLVGPGRVAVQSAYPREGHEYIVGTSGRVAGAWENLGAGRMEDVRPAAQSVTASIPQTPAQGHQSSTSHPPSAAHPAFPSPYPAPPALSRTRPQRAASSQAGAPTHAKDVVKQLIARAMVNGDLSAADLARVTAEAEKHGFAPYDVRTLIHQVRGELHRLSEGG